MTRNLWFVFATLLAVAAYWAPLRALASLSLGVGIYPYIMVMPLLSVGLIYLEKESIFSRVRYDFGVGFLLLFLAAIIRLCSRWVGARLGPHDSLSVVILSFVALWVGIFILCYGRTAFRAAAFQLLLLLLMVPLPQGFLARSIFLLRGCSAEVAGFILKLVGVPVFRNGFRLSLPITDVEVAEQCSGIRSGIALFITSLLMGHLFLRTPWRRLWLVLAIFPITVFKNGLRIVTIYGLTIHPSMEPLTAWVHRYGGIPFSFLGLLLMGFLVTSLRRFEDHAIGSQWLMPKGET